MAGCLARHAEVSKVLPRERDVLSLEDFLRRSTSDVGWSSTGFHFGLLPVPYMGDLRTAKVFILTQNPGFAPRDYFAEGESEETQHALLANLRQEDLGPEFPFLSLNPKFAWHGGFRYWTNWFQEIIDELSVDRRGYLEALSVLAKEVCVLQSVPYRSHKKPGLSEQQLARLESTTRIVQFVGNAVAPAARRGERWIVVARESKVWGARDWKAVSSDYLEVVKGNPRSPYASPSARKLLRRALNLP